MPFLFPVQFKGVLLSLFCVFTCAPLSNKNLTTSTPNTTGSCHLYLRIYFQQKLNHLAEAPPWRYALSEQPMQRGLAISILPIYFCLSNKNLTTSPHVKEYCNRVIISYRVRVLTPMQWDKAMVISRVHIYPSTFTSAPLSTIGKAPSRRYALSGQPNTKGLALSILRIYFFPFAQPKLNHLGIPLPGSH
eukprot:Pgem_evm1s2232